MEHQGIEAQSSTAPKNQKQNQNGITIPSTVDRWIQAKGEPDATSDDADAGIDPSVNTGPIKIAGDPGAPAVDVTSLGRQLLGTWADVRLAARALTARPELQRIEGQSMEEYRASGTFLVSSGRTARCAGQMLFLASIFV